MATAKKKAVKKTVKKVAKKKNSAAKGMKSYPSFDAWKMDQSANVQKLIIQLRQLVNGLGLPLEEDIKWGNAVWVKEKLPIVFLYAMEDGIQFGFFIGSQLKDPKKRLTGNGKYVKAIHVYAKADIDEAYFSGLVKQAIKIKYR